MTPNQRRKVRIGTVNVGMGLLQKVPYLLELMEEEMLDALFLQETGADVVSVPGLPPNRRFIANGQGLGVAMILNAWIADRITQVEDTVEGVLSIATHKIALTSIYCPTALDFERDGSVRLLEATKRHDAATRFGLQHAINIPHVIGGDFNETRTAADASGSSHRRHGRLINLLLPEYTDVVRHFRPHATRAEATYLDPRGSWSRLDHLFLRQENNGRYHSKLVHADMRDMPDLRSRHRAVICTLEMNVNDPSPENIADGYTPRYFRVASSSRAQKEAYAERVNIRLESWVQLASDIASHGDTDDVTVLCDQLTATILTVAEQELGTTTGKSSRMQLQLKRNAKRRRQLQKCLRLLNQPVDAASDSNLSLARTALVRNGWDPAALVSRDTLRSMLRTAIRANRKAARATRTRNPSWNPRAKSVVASMSTAREPSISSIIDHDGQLRTEKAAVHATLLQHFGTMMTSSKSDSEQPTEDNGEENENLAELMEMFEIDEVRSLVCSDKCRWYSAAGLDGLTEGLVRVAASYSQSANVLVILTAAFNAMLRLGDVPSLLKRYVMHPIQKVRGCINVAKVRPITLIPATARLLYKLLANRQQEAAQRDPTLFHGSQHGFLRGRSAQDAIRTRVAACFHAKAIGSYMYNVLYDFAGAYDSVEHHILERALRKLGYPANYVHFTRQRLKGVTVKVRTRHGVSEDAVEMQKGIRQGDPEACLFWNCVADMLLRTLNVRLNENGFDFGDNNRVSAIAFADDLTTMSSTADGISKLHREVVSFCREHQLKLNATKCVMQYSPESAPVPPSLMVGDDEIKVSSIVQVPRYLGVRSAIDGSTAAAEADIRSIVGRYCRRLRAEGAHMGISEAIRFVNVHMGAKLTYQAGAMSVNMVSSLDYQVTAAASTAFSLGAAIPQDILHILCAVTVPSAIFAAAHISETLLQVNNSECPQRRALLSASNHRDSPIKRAAQSAGQAHLALEIHGRRERQARETLVAERIEDVPIGEGNVLMCDGAAVSWNPDSRALYRTNRPRASSGAVRVCVSAAAVTADGPKEEFGVREFVWSAIVLDDTLAANPSVHRLITERSAEGTRARANAPIVGQRTKLDARLTPDQVAMAAAASALVALPSNVAVDVMLPWSANLRDSVLQQLEADESLRTHWKRTDAAYRSILQLIIRQRSRMGSTTEFSCWHDAPDSAKELTHAAQLAVELRLIAKGNLPQPALATDSATLSMVTSSGEVIGVSGAWRTCVKHALMRVSYESASAKCDIIPELKLTLADIGRIRKACCGIPDQRLRQRVLRWVTNLFLSGRNVYTDEFYGRRVETPVCDCKQQRERPTLLHYVHCVERRATSDAAIATMALENSDETLRLILRHVRDRAMLNPRVCLGLDLQDLGRSAGQILRINQHVLDFCSRCWPDF